MVEIFKDTNGKYSSKRVAGVSGVFVALVAVILKFFFPEPNVSDTLILGVLTASLGAISVGTFEKKKEQ